MSQSIVPRSSKQTNVPTRRWDPVWEMEDLHDRMAQLMQGFFGEPAPSIGGRQGPAWFAPVDIEELDDAFVVDLDLPNVKREDVHIELRDKNTLRIFGEIKEKERTGMLRRSTRRVGEFEYLVVLPGDVDPERAEATLSDGVLTLRVAKAEATKPRQIEVKAGAGG